MLKICCYRIRFFVSVTIKFFNRFFSWKMLSSVNLVSIYVRTKLRMKHSKFHKVFCGFRFWANCVFFSSCAPIYILFLNESRNRCMHLVCGAIIIDSHLCAHELYESKPYIESTYSPFYLFTYFVNIFNGRFAFIHPYFVVQLKIFCIILHFVGEKEKQRHRQNAKKTPTLLKKCHHHFASGDFIDSNIVKEE